MDARTSLATILILSSTAPILHAATESPDIQGAVSNIRPGTRLSDVKVPWVLKNCAEFFKTETPGCPVKGSIPTPFGTAQSAILDWRDGVVTFIRYTYPLDEPAFAARAASTGRDANSELHELERL